MPLVDDTARDIATLPLDACRMTAADWSTLARIQRRLHAALEERVPALAQYDLVNEQSRAIEKEWYRAELGRTGEVLAAHGVFDDWWSAAGVDAVNARLATNHAAERRAMAKLRRRIRKLADPTAPGWKPPPGVRLGQTLETFKRAGT